MKWIGRKQSENIDDRRGSSKGKAIIGGGLIGIVIIVLKILSGGDANEILNQAVQDQIQGQHATAPENQLAEDSLAQFVSVVLADNEDVWTKLLQENHQRYIEPQMVLFRDRVESGCGNAASSLGPFYCPADQKVYIDLSFFNELKNNLGAAGDFAIAYVVAHEVGHHVQNLLGTSDKVHQAQAEMSKVKANKLSVALELQADFYAGIWAHYNDKMNHVLEEGDIEEALTAAAAVGDDRLQKASTGEVVPDAFTHGTSEQRMYWFKLGYTTGDISKGNTFEKLKL